MNIKKYLPRTLFGRSLLILITPVLLLQVITTFVFFDRHWNRMSSRLAFAVAGEVAVIAGLIEGGNGDITDMAARNLGMNVRFKAGESLGISEERFSAYVWENVVANTLERQLTAQLSQPFLLDVDFSKKQVQVFVQLDSGVLQVSLSQSRLFSSSGYIFLLWMIGSSLVLLIIAILFMRNQIRPIRKLAAAAESFGKGRDVASFKPGGAREVRQAAQSFIDMQRRIKRQIEQRTTMLAGVSHDLRTPLTRLKLQLAMLEDSPDVTAMKGDVEEMERMIGGYLDFMRGEGDEQVSITSLNDLLNKVAGDARRQGLSAEISIEREINLMLRPMAFERCLANIVGNAGKHADNVWITVREEGEDKKLEITIEDDGPGIAEDKYEEVFRPFYCVDTSRNASTGGVGLGLPIAMDIVSSHGGNITMSKSEHGGLKVAIRLPI